MNIKKTAIVGISAIAVTASVMASATAVSSPGDESHINIVGGTVTDQSYPWTVSLGGCGGSLVAPQWVVTAAHCIERGGPRQVRMASNDKYAGGETVSVERVILHPGYRDGQTGTDIGLIKLATPASTTPIAIAREVGPINTPTKILGWGATRADGRGGSRYLKELDTQTLPASSCRGIAGPFSRELEICTDNPGGNQGACFGDSGGPQVKEVNGRFELVGATSRGENTCARRASIYTSVPAHLDWLREASNNDIPAPGTQPTPNPTTTTTPTPTPNPTTTTTPTPTPTNTFPDDEVTPNPNGRLITVDVSQSGEYRDEMIKAMNIWNSVVPEMNLQIASSGRRANVTVSTGTGWPYAQPRGLGRGHVHMGTRAMDIGHKELRVATHELGHIFGMPDRRTGKCEDLMSGSSAGTDCANPMPNQKEIDEVRGYFNRYADGSRSMQQFIGSTCNHGWDDFTIDPHHTH